MANILIIDDVEDVRDALTAILQGAGHTVEEAKNGAEGIARLSEGRYDLVITDILMPEKDGTEVIMHLETLPSRPRVMAISGGGARMPAYMALHLARLKADATLMKPFTNAELMGKVNALL